MASVRERESEIKKRKKEREKERKSCPCTPYNVCLCHKSQINNGGRVIKLNYMEFLRLSKG